MTEETAKRYVSRAQAAKAAYAHGHMFFRTKRDPIQKQYWTFMRRSVPLDKPAAFDWAKGKDWVRWVEADWVDEGRQPGYINVLMVSCLKSEIPPAELAEAEALGYRIEPQTPSMWEKEDARDMKTMESAKRKATLTLGKPRSESKGATKRVWEIADALGGMPTRAEVVAACVAEGIHEQTAMTQYYRWKKAKNA